MTGARAFGLVWPYAAGAALGYLLGMLVLAALAGGSSSSAASRVGFVLRERPHAPAPAWSALGADLQAVRSGLVPPQREVFELLVAVHGLDNGGDSDWTRAELVCRGLGWPHCDRAALAQLKEQSLP